MQETQDLQVQSLGWEDVLEKEMASHSSMLAWRIPEENPIQRSLADYSPWGHRESDMTEQQSKHTHIHIEKPEPSMGANWLRIILVITANSGLETEVGDSQANVFPGDSR